MTNEKILTYHEISEYAHDSSWYYFDDNGADSDILCTFNKSRYYQTKQGLSNRIPINIKYGIISFAANTAIINADFDEESHDFNPEGVYLLIDFFLLSEDAAKEFQNELKEKRGNVVCPK